MSYRENQEKPPQKTNLQNNREPSLRLTLVDPRPGSRQPHAMIPIWALRCEEAIETGGIIRPLGIAEIGCAAGEHVCAHRGPDGIR